MLDLSMLGAPVLLGEAFTGSSAELECVSNVTGDGQTAVVIGVDWYFAATVASQGFGTLLGASGANFWGGWAALAPVIFGGGLQWRGAYPLYPGQTLTAIGSILPGGSAVGIAIWGRVVPYVAA